jgi:hypothetical protein
MSSIVYKPKCKGGVARSQPITAVQYTVAKITLGRSNSISNLPMGRVQRICNPWKKIHFANTCTI